MCPKDGGGKGMRQFELEAWPVRKVNPLLPTYCTPSFLLWVSILIKGTFPCPAESLVLGPCCTMWPVKLSETVTKVKV